MIRRVGSTIKLKKPKSELERAMRYYRENLQSDRVLYTKPKSPRRPKSATKTKALNSLLSDTKDSKESLRNPILKQQTSDELSSFIESLSFLRELRFELELNYNATKNDQIESHLIGDYFSLKNMIEKLSDNHLDSLKDLSKIIRALIRKLKDQNDKVLLELFWRASIKATENLLQKHHKDNTRSEKLHQIQLKQTKDEYDKESTNMHYKIKALQKQVEILKNELKLNNKQKKKLYREMINREAVIHEMPKSNPEIMSIFNHLVMKTELIKTDLSEVNLKPPVQILDKKTQTDFSVLKTQDFHPFQVIEHTKNCFKPFSQVMDFCKLVLKKWKGEPFWHKFLTEIIRKYPNKSSIETEIASYFNSFTSASFVVDKQSLFYYKMLDISNRKPYKELYKVINCVSREFCCIETGELAPLDKTIFLVKAIFKNSKGFASELLESLVFEPEDNLELPSFIDKNNTYRRDRTRDILCRVSLVLHERIPHFKSLVERTLLNTGNMSGAQIAAILTNDFDIWLSTNEQEHLSNFLGPIISIEKVIKKLAILKHFDIAKREKICKYELLNKIYDNWSKIEDRILNKLAPIKESISLKNLEEFLGKIGYCKRSETVGNLFRDLLLGSELKKVCEDYKLLYEEFPKIRNISILNIKTLS